MTTTENKYQRGKIYKIISNQTNDVYYGSTVEQRITNRLSGHRQNYKRWLTEKYPYVTSFEIIKFEDAKIILVENFPCNTRYELLAREQHYIDNNECVNKHNAYTGLTRLEYCKQYYVNNIEKIKQNTKHYRYEHIEEIKQYRKDNKDIISKQRKQYNEKNKDVISERKKQYNEKNKIKNNEKCRQYHETNKSKLNEHINCICGGKYSYQHKSTHEKTKKHKQFISNQLDTKNNSVK